LLLLDWHMMPISGLEFIQGLKSRIPAEEMPPVIVLTADPSHETRREALAVGATDFLAKPLDPSEVLLRIRNQLEMHRVRRELRESRLELERRSIERTKELERTIDNLRAGRRPKFRRQAKA
jgi:putative two-component system response regulator